MDNTLLTMKTLIKILCLSVLWFSCEDNTSPHGCLDSQACNYDSNATIDNNSCFYPEDWEDECGVCDLDASNDCIQDCYGEWGGDGECDISGTWRYSEGIIIQGHLIYFNTTLVLTSDTFSYIADSELAGNAISWLPSGCEILGNLTLTPIEFILIPDSMNCEGNLPSSVNFTYLLSEAGDTLTLSSDQGIFPHIYTRLIY